MNANYPDERGRGVEPISPKLMRRVAAQYEEMLRREAEYARLEDEVYAAYRRMSVGSRSVQCKETKP